MVELFPCLRGETYWPLTASVGFFRAPLDSVTKAMMPRGRRSPWVRFAHGTLDDALRSHAPYGSTRVTFLLSSGDGSWTTVVGTRFLAADFASTLAARAYYALGCEFVGCSWRPVTPVSEGGATFVHERARPRRWGPVGRFVEALGEAAEDVAATGHRVADRIARGLPVRERDHRSVETGEVGGYFSASGEPRAFEEPAYYRRRAVDRLPRELLARYAAAVGVAVDDPAWWDGPVTVLADVNRPSGAERMPVGGGQSWSTIEDLRGWCRYPLEGVPDELVPRARAAERRTTQHRSHARERLLARIGDVNDVTRPRPLVTVPEFFDGNDDPASIGANLPDHPPPRDFHALLSAIAARPDVADVRIEVKDLEDPEGWPSTDTIWFFTSAGVETVRAWFPERLAPDDVTALDEPDGSVEAYEVPPGTRVITAWYD